MNAKQKKKDCKQIYLGCGGCLEPICEGCWPTYGHNLAEQSIDKYCVLGMTKNGPVQAELQYFLQKVLIDVAELEKET
eukprot:scaffold14273_cov21-Cyclotella_meneghiniana.AAC.1